MNRFDCNICFEKYDRAQHKPHALDPCGHSFCILCVKNFKEKRCPNCNAKFNKSYLNQDLLNALDPSSVDKAKLNLEAVVNETEQLKKDLQQNYDTRLKETNEQMKKLRSDLNAKAEDVIKLIHANQRKLLDQAISTENKLKEELSEKALQEHKAIQEKLNECRSLLQSSDETKLNSIMSELAKKKYDLKMLLNKMKSTETDYIFEENPYTKITSSLLGEISLRRAEPSDKSKLISQMDDIILSLNEDEKEFNKKFPSRGVNVNTATSRINTNPQRSEADMRKLSDLMTKATDCLKRFTFKKAIEYLDEIIEIDPTFYDPYGRKGHALGQLERYQEAIKCFDESIKIEPNNPLVHIQRGESYRELKQFPEALTNFNKAIEIDSQNAKAYLEKGRILFQMNRMNESLDSFEMAEALESDNYFNAQYKVLCLINLRRHNEAIIYANRAIASNPLECQFYMAKSNIYLDQLRLDIGLEVINEGLRHLPDNPYLLSTKENIERMLRGDRS